MNRRYIFVCRHNFTRSRFGAEFLRGYLNSKKREFEVISRGVGWTSIFLGKKLSKEDLIGVRKIFVMEGYMKDWILKRFGGNPDKIVVLNIPDKYGFLKKRKVVDLDRIFQNFDWEKYL
jgi:predicted protein tyrosine phosphatase